MCYLLTKVLQHGEEFWIKDRCTHHWLIVLVLLLKFGIHDYHERLWRL